MAKKRKVNQRAKYLAIAFAVIALLTYVMKEGVTENLRDLRSSIATAEAQFQSQSNQSSISMQIFAAQQDIENFTLAANSKHKLSPRESQAIISEDVRSLRLAQSRADADLESLSKLIDSLPRGARYLAESRDQIQSTLKENRKQVEGVLGLKTTDENQHVVNVKMALAMELVSELHLILLEDVTLTAANRIQEALETLIRWCTRLAYILGLLGLLLGVYAAHEGMKTKTAE